MGSALLILLLVLFVAAWPRWPYSRRWGFYPAAGTLALLVLVAFLVWFGYLALDWPRLAASD